MRAVCQRVRWARVVVGDDVVGEIEAGWTILLGIGEDDDDAAAERLIDRIVKLRAFDDDRGRMQRSAEDVGAQFLIVSQITLHADLSRGRRPSFSHAAAPALAQRLVAGFVARLRTRGFTVATGRFGAMMAVELCNDGPVTFVLSSDPGDGWE
jgi:D-tyrosyl-tRNA(Tyr) deacylase